MPKVKLDTVPQNNMTGYPPPYAQAVQERWVRRMTAALGLQDFGMSHVTLRPGAWSSQRHWHEGEDELVVMVAGEAVLVDDNGRTSLRPGDIAVFPKNDGNGHHLVNESPADCTFVAVGRAAKSPCHYSDIDLHFDPAAGRYTHKDGSPFG
ncbi:MAG: transcriptional regulator [Sphingobium sp.]|nr:MAG: transcriptional regulator [Sphingobium sp.]